MEIPLTNFDRPQKVGNTICIFAMGNRKRHKQRWKRRRQRGRERERRKGGKERGDNVKGGEACPVVSAGSAAWPSSYNKLA